MKRHFLSFTCRLLMSAVIWGIAVSTAVAQKAAAQTWQDLKQSNANFNDVKAAFLQANESRMGRAMREMFKEASRPERKSDKFERELEGIMQFMRWSEFVEPRVAESQGDLSVIQEGNVRALAQQANAVQSRAATWRLIGPRNTPTTANSYGGNGRVNTVRVHPTNSNILFACTPAGGLWKSTNAGASWTAISDAIAVLGATDVAFDPTNPNIMYLATGDGDASDTYSTGVYKSTDGGNTWAVTGLNFTTSQYNNLSKILVHPTNNQLLLVCGNGGIRRSTNGGTSWTTVSTANIMDLEWKPNNPSVVYAGGYGSSSGVWRSLDAGATWTRLTVSSLPASGTTKRVAIAVTPHDSSYVYALYASASDNGFQGLYRSIDGGTTWTQQSTTPNLLGWQASGTDSGGQGWYTLSVAVSPTDKNLVMVGGVNIWKSINGGTTWTCSAQWSGSGAPYVHADIHNFEYTASALYVANDGGVFKSINSGTTWTDLSSNLANAQIYSLGLSTTDPNLIISGHQDNGTNLTNDTLTWRAVLGGDGMQCFIDRTNNNRLFASVQNGSLRRSINGGASFSTVLNVTNGAWVTPWLQDPVTPATIYAAGSEVHKSIDYGTNWTDISAFGGTTATKSLDVAKTNPLCILAATSSTVRKTNNGGTSWTTLTGLPTSGILTVHFNVNDENKIYVGVASYQGSSVWYSANGGSTWTNWSTGLPSIPVSSFVTQLGTDGSMYCGTDIGVYYRNNASTTWTAFTQGMPGVPVRDLEIYYPTQKLRAATYGRGIWESNLEVAVSGYTISANVNPITAGSVTGAGFFQNARSVSLVAIPNTGWTFLNWTENGTIVSTNATFTFNAATNRTFQANFTGGPVAACGNATLTTCQGTVTDGSGALNYDNDLTCTWLIRPTTPPSQLLLTFTAFATESGYDYVTIYDGISTSGRLLGTYSGTTLPPRLVATSGAFFIRFTTDANTVNQGWSANYSCVTGTLYNVALSANPMAAGVVSGDGAYIAQDSATVVATDNAGYVFTNWTDSTGTILSTNSTYRFRVTANRRLTANFRMDGCQGLTTYNTCSGTVTDGSSANYGNGLTCTWLIQPVSAASITLHFTQFATELDYDSVAVYDGMSAAGRFLGKFSGTSLPADIVATSGAMFIRFTTDVSLNAAGWAANWTCTNNVVTYALSLNANPVAGGNVYGGGTYPTGQSVRARAVPNTGWNFLNWTENGSIVSSDTAYSFNLAANRTLTANFSQAASVTINTVVFPLACGTTLGSGTYAAGQNVTLTATAEPQFVFDKWTENNLSVSTNRVYTFAAGSNRTLTAVFRGVLNTDWDVTPTSENHTLVVPLNTSVQLGNGGLQLGDYVGVFYTDSNRLKCAGRQVWNGAATSVTAYGNDLATGKNGFALTERFTWRVFRPSTRMQYDVDATYLPMTGIYTHQGNYARDGISGLTNLTMQIGDTLRLAAGWNMVGIYIQPTDSTLATMLAPIANQLILMKTIDGRNYIPSTGINTIQYWNVREGYRIKMAQAVDIVLSGRRIDPLALQIPFSAGWSIIPYVRTTPMLFPTVFASNTAQIDLAKDNLGQTWIPSLSINNIGNAAINQAYKVKFNTAGILSQPVNRRGDEPIENPNSARYFAVLKQPTGEDATIILTQTLFKDVLQIGDEVGVFNATGLLCGSTIWNGENTAIAVKGDDLATAPQEGMKVNDNYQLYVKRPNIALPMRLNVTFENPNQAHYAADNISRFTKVSLPEMPTLPLVEKAFAYPNPVGSMLTIQLESDDADAIIELQDLMGHVLQLNTEQRMRDTIQIWTFDTAHLPAGSYVYTVKTVHKTHHGTFIIQH